jgi:hypothetical protein
MLHKIIHCLKQSFFLMLQTKQRIAQMRWNHIAKIVGMFDDSSSKEATLTTASK